MKIVGSLLLTPDRSPFCDNTDQDIAKCYEQPPEENKSEPEVIHGSSIAVDKDNKSEWNRI